MQLRFLPLLTLLAAFTTGLQAAERPVVGLDRYYHHETRNGRPYHYAWEDTAPSGYSKLQELIEKLGAKTTSIAQPASAEMLANVDIYLLVTPGTPTDDPATRPLDDAARQAIVAWVKSGGVLVLLNNDKDHAEFANTNRLAQQFGITFHEDVRFGLKADPKRLQMHSFPDHPFFQGVSKLHMRSVCTLSVRPPAEVVYRFQGDEIMALCRYGQGTVFALGDPWGYNEYIDFFDNRTALSNVFRELLARTGKAAKMTVGE